MEIQITSTNIYKKENRGEDIMSTTVDYMKTEFLKCFNEREITIMNQLGIKHEREIDELNKQILNLKNDNNNNKMPDIDLPSLYSKGFALTYTGRNHYDITTKATIEIKSYYMRKNIYKLPKKLHYKKDFLITFSFYNDGTYKEVYINKLDCDEIYLFHTSSESTCTGDDTEIGKTEPTIEKLEIGLKHFLELNETVNITSLYTPSDDGTLKEIYYYIKKKYEENNLDHTHLVFEDEEDETEPFEEDE